MSEIRTDITKLSVNLTDRAMVALGAAAEATGDTHTDTVNRALQLYAFVVELHGGGRGWGRFTFLTDAPKTCRVEVNRPWWRIW